MRSILLLLTLLFGSTTFGQGSLDTIEVYNGELTRKRIEFKPSGEISKEIYFYPNGKIKTEYFFDGSTRIRWISYDTTGKKTSEWNDPEIGFARTKKLRNITFSLSLIVLLGLIVAGRRINYQKTYYSLLCLSLIYPFTILFLQKRIDGNGENQLLPMIIMSTLLIIPFLLLILTFINFYKRKKIPVITSIFAILASVGFLIFYYLMLTIGGAGILG